jgi:cellulose synthase/poly-beta-1,6-N-acetylglucosamine synthase-like glycosyltransferase
VGFSDFISPDEFIFLCDMVYKTFVSLKMFFKKEGVLKKYILYLLLMGFFYYTQSRSIPVFKEKPMVVVTCMYNNERWVEKNLTMIFSQEYKNFRVIIVDDGSTDSTVDIIEKFITSHGIEQCVTFIKNKVRK